MVWAAIRAANMLLPGGPGAQKDTLMCVPASSLPSVSRCASSAISAVANSKTANRRKLPSCPWANCREVGGKKQLFESHTHTRFVLMPINTVHRRLSDRPVVTAWTPNVRVTSKSTFMFKKPCKNPWNVPEFLLKINLKSCWKFPNRKSCV